MNRNRTIDSVLILLLLVGLSTFPVGMFVKDAFWYYVIESLLMLAIILFILFYLSRHPYLKPEKRDINAKNLLLFLPLLIACISNFIYAWIFNETYHPDFSIGPAIITAMITCLVLSVIAEELSFRYILLSGLPQENKLVRILISAAIFALCHLSSFLTSFWVGDLVIVLYTFGLGIILGFIYIYGHSLIACVVYHFIFNFMNQFLFAHLYSATSWMFYLINGIIALLAGIYLFLIYFFILNKKPSRTRLN